MAKGQYLPKTRSEIMSSVKGKNTGPELKVRRLVHRMGYRFRLHRRNLPGSPDVVLPGRKKVIFVNGCFWHDHSCRRGDLPKTNTEYWRQKFERNKDRDSRNLEELRKLGWETLVIWSCELRDSLRIEAVLRSFLDA
ncbi:MAG: very short patch repair endonuclease [bacterium]|nr:very short patch repair endonuclease [bacterium]